MLTHFDIVQVPYYLQMMRAAMVAAIQILRIHQARHYRVAVTPLQRTLIARWLAVTDMAFLFLAFMAVGVSAGRDPVVPRDEVLMVIRLSFTVSAVCGIAAEALLLALMARHEGDNGEA